MTAHWIEVKDGIWKMRGSVIGFKAISGAHDGENLGRYTVGLLERVGIMDKKSSKVSWFLVLFCVLTSEVSDRVFHRVFQLYAATLDNTGNNNTTCKTIEDIHVRRGLKWNSKEQQLPYYVFLIISSNTTDYLNLLAVALGMSSTSEMLISCLTSRRLQLLKMQLLFGSMTPRETTIGFWEDPWTL
jgi:hypothetical protein